MSLNKVQLIGHVGKEPEIRKLDSGVNVCNFSLATTEAYKDKKGELVKTTEWHKIVIWNRLVDVVEKYVKKGSQIYVEGKLRTRSYDHKDGYKVYSTEIVVTELNLLGSKPSDGSQKAEQQAAVAETVSTASDNLNPDENNDLPF
jgi:single-strand DNA-binding protein